MEVKLSISSSRRISFASDFKDIDEGLEEEVEELEKIRDNPNYNCRINYNSEWDRTFDDYEDEGGSNYVKFTMKLNFLLFSVIELFAIVRKTTTFSSHCGLVAKSEELSSFIFTCHFDMLFCG